MMRAPTILLLAVLAAACASARAAVTYSFVPASPRSTDVVQLRIDTTQCFLAGAGVLRIDPVEPSIELEFHGTDTGCDPNVPGNMETPRFQTIGKLPPGNYATRIYACGFGADGVFCNLRSEGQLLVQGVTGRRHSIPMLSGWGLASTLVLLLGGGVIAWRWIGQHR